MKQIPLKGNDRKKSKGKGKNKATAKGKNNGNSKGKCKDKSKCRSFDYASLWLAPLRMTASVSEGCIRVR